MKSVRRGPWLLLKLRLGELCCPLPPQHTQPTWVQHHSCLIHATAGHMPCLTAKSHSGLSPHATFFCFGILLCHNVSSDVPRQISDHHVGVSQGVDSSDIICWWGAVGCPFGCCHDAALLPRPQLSRRWTGCWLRTRRWMLPSASSWPRR